MRKPFTFQWPVFGRLSESSILLILAVVLGLTTGAGVWLFRHGIEFFRTFIVRGFLLTYWNRILDHCANTWVGWSRRWSFRQLVCWS